MLKSVLGGFHRAASKQFSQVFPRAGNLRHAARSAGVLTLPIAMSSKILAHRALSRFIKSSRLVFLVVCCLHAKANTPGEFVPKKEHWKNPRGFSIPNPKAKAVVVFLHGSFIEKLDDKCDPNGDASGFSVPEVVRQLAGTAVGGLEVVVYAPCHGQATAMGEPIKIDQRVTAIEQTLAELARAGVDPSRIVLVGHSAGGWAALLHEKRHPGSVNSVIAFAPAFAGEKRGRPEVWQQRHDAQAAEIGSAERIPALVFSFDNDAYNTPGDLGFLSRIKGTTLLRMPDKAIAGVACEIPFLASSHAHAYRKCFSDTQASVLLEFLQKHLRGQELSVPVIQAIRDNSIAEPANDSVSAGVNVSLGESPKR